MCESMCAYFSMFVCVHLHVCGLMSVSALQLGEKNVTQIRTICTVFTTCNKVLGSNQSQVSESHILLNFVSCLCTVALQRDAATATDNMLINWDCTTMPP